MISIGLQRSPAKQAKISLTRHRNNHRSTFPSSCDGDIKVEMGKGERWIVEGVTGGESKRRKQSLVGCREGSSGCDREWGRVKSCYLPVQNQSVPATDSPCYESVMDDVAVAARRRPAPGSSSLCENFPASDSFFLLTGSVILTFC